jgi:hypothetical protein
MIIVVGMHFDKAIGLPECRWDGKQPTTYQKKFDIKKFGNDHYYN